MSGGRQRYRNGEEETGGIGSTVQASEQACAKRHMGQGFRLLPPPVQGASMVLVAGGLREAPTCCTPWTSVTGGLGVKQSRVCQQWCAVGVLEICDYAIWGVEGS